MKKILFSLILLFSTGIFAQEEAKDTLYVRILNPETTRVVLYGADGARQKYIGYSDNKKEGSFKIAIPSGVPKGILRLIYDQRNMRYVDFLYSGKSLHFEFDQKKPEGSLKFEDSPENVTYSDTVNKLLDMQFRLDTLQVRFYKIQDKEQRSEIKKQYAGLYKEYDAFIQQFDSTQQSTWLKDLVHANLFKKPGQIIEDPQEYLPYVRQHYFDYIDFENPNIIHTPILLDRVMDYVFYLTSAPDKEVQNRNYIVAITNLMSRIKNDELRAGVIKTLIQNFARAEKVEPVDYLLTEYYDKLPKELQNDAYRYGIVHDLQAAVGRTAPDFEWEQNGEKMHLAGLEGYDYYVLVFWSSTCPHCLRAMPELYKYLKDQPRIKVIMVGLENEQSLSSWKTETVAYPGFIQVLGMGKWEYPPARTYNIDATPEYFILDKNKKIIAKPYALKDLVDFFEREAGIIPKTTID